MCTCVNVCVVVCKFFCVGKVTFSSCNCDCVQVVTYLLTVKKVTDNTVVENTLIHVSTLANPSTGKTPNNPRVQIILITQIILIKLTYISMFRQRVNLYLFWVLIFFFSPCLT